MLFNSLSFLIFFPICILVFWALPKRAGKYWLLAASFFFYMCWNVKYALLLLTSILVTFFSALLLEKFEGSTSKKKLVLAAGLTVNFSILFLFKYLDFFISNLNKILGIFGGNGHISAFSLLLPVGISFYIFQAVGYTIDVYRGAKPEKNIVTYALFVSFFPQLVAGPIERSKNLLGQIRLMDERKNISADNIVSGSLYMLYGFFMKLMIADRASILVANVYNIENYSSYEGFAIVLAAVLFSLQIYCDFAGYSYIAIGAARVMGFTLCENFNAPYLSTGIRDFWDRWHISLSTWFRDYLYFPLGGSKKGIKRKYLNILIVFLISGLWHGAAWHFVVWGMLHGILRVIEEITYKSRHEFYKKIGYDCSTLSHGILAGIVNFIIVTVCWMFFRAESIGQAIGLIRNMLSGMHIWQLFDDSLLKLGLDGKEMNVLFISILFVFIIDILKRMGKDIISFIKKQNEWFVFVLFFMGIITIVIFGVYGAKYDASTFIYFQF